jgi:hypothetical protein
VTVIERSKCPTCGGDVVIHTGDEGTSHMVPANNADQTAAFIERDQLQAAVEALRRIADGRYTGPNGRRYRFTSRDLRDIAAEAVAEIEQ